MANQIEELLVSLGICRSEAIVDFHPRVRDRKDISVRRCAHSGVIFLSGVEHLSESRFEDQKAFEYWGTEDRQRALLTCVDDDRRRAQQFGPIIRSRRWLDIGTGVGGILELLAAEASDAWGVEPHPAARADLQKCGYQVCAQLTDINDKQFDVVTLFHVFEHLWNPIEILQQIADRMASGATLVVEVPHANDFLLSFLGLEAFKEFTLWSEHLILHTRFSLEVFLRTAGFKNITISGYQRYPLANHLYWLTKQKPGGHREWSVLRSEELDAAYQAKLCELDKTDTLIALATK